MINQDNKKMDNYNNKSNDKTNIRKKSILEKLNKEWIFLDGGAGTMLQAMGLKGGELPERWNIQQPDKVRSLYRGYIDAGSMVITTNTFGANRLKYADDLESIVYGGVKLAIEAREEAREEAKEERDIFIALDLGPTGKLLKPLGDLGFEDAVSIYGEIVRIGEAAGADLILIETMSDSYELKAAVLGAKENSSLPVFATVTFDGGGKLLTGGTVKAIVPLLEGLKVDALGVNCSLGPREMIPIIRELTEEASVPIIVTPNAGLPRTENGETVYDISPDDFSEYMVEIAGMGVQCLGGCCGTTPEHMRMTIEKCRELPFKPNVEKNKAYVTSFAQAVEIGGRPKIVGERINPTGKKKLQEAVRNEDMAYILSEGIKQEDNGAHILDVNVGLPDIDEPLMMERVVKELQGISALPLQLDTANPKALERGLRIYNGKAMVNSVNGKQSSLDEVLQLVAKYGGVLVGLPLDEDGIPETPEGRIEIAKRIYTEAAKYGIPSKDVVIDGLTLTVSADGNAGKTTLETVRAVKEELGGNTILGVSNVSFGLPHREIINANFLSMALSEGLSCAILNPGNEAMMDAYRSAMALLGFDESCTEYISEYGEKLKEESHTAAMSLSESVERGLAKNAVDAAHVELKGRDPLSIINEDIVPALDKVGQGFEQGRVFLPQLLMSAEAAKGAFNVIKEALPEKQGEKKGNVIVATVKGDIHDIGKNIVKVLLDNYGFNVIDLGKDVAPERIVERAKSENIKLVGLSALMTTTVVSMKETIELLRRECPDVNVVVSGAVLSQNYADMMGADHYAKDAMGTVRYAEKILKSEN